jgi:hypothetical protein
MTRRTGLWLLTSALICCVPASGADYGISIYLEAGYTTASAWTEVDYWEAQAWCWEPVVEANYSSNKGYSSYEEDYGEFEFGAYVDFVDWPPPGDVEYTLYSTHYVRVSYDYSLVELGSFNVTVEYDDPNDPGH